jgi:hypothetical protein
MHKAGMFSRSVFYTQGTYFFLTGIWPLIDINSFMTVSCPKTDIWLVKAMGAILLCEGICFLLSGMTNDDGFPMRVLALISALALALIDCYYVATGTICNIYLADAALEFLFVICWIFAIFKRHKPIRYENNNTRPKEYSH